MFFMILCTIIAFAVTVVILGTVFREVLFPCLIGALIGLLALVLSFLVLCATVNVGANEVLSSTTYNIATITSTDNQISYYAEHNGDYIIFTEEDNKLVQHETEYDKIHFLKEHEKAYAIREERGFKSAFWNRMFAFPNSPFTVYKFYVPVT